MNTVRKILTEKGEHVWTIDIHETVYRVLERMSDLSVGALVVMENRRPVGIVTERDYARKVILNGKSSKTTLVGEIQSTEMVVADLNWTVEQCMIVMTEYHIRHLPVIEQGCLKGIVSIGDVVKAIISDQYFKIDQLSRYFQFQCGAPEYAISVRRIESSSKLV